MRIAALATLAIGLTLSASAAVAEPVAVRFAEGIGRGFPVLRDANGRTIVSASSLEKDAGAKGANAAAAKAVGALIAKKAKDKGITRVVFDRGGYLYHGNIKALADAARENGLEF